MKHKKGAIGLVVGIIIAVFLVGAVAYITLHSFGASVTSILEPLKKLVGIETNKAEASNTKNGECTIKRYYWSKNNVKIGEKVEIIIEGSGNCNGKNVNINIFKDISFWFDSQLKLIDAPFKETIININWPTEKGKYYFVLKFGDYTSPESGRLEIV